jgi:hypothetical protein
MLLAAWRPLDIHVSGKKSPTERLLALDYERNRKKARANCGEFAFIKFSSDLTHFYQRTKVLVPCLWPP